MLEAFYKLQCSASDQMAGTHGIRRTFFDGVMSLGAIWTSIVEANKDAGRVEESITTRRRAARLICGVEESWLASGWTKSEEYASSLRDAPLFLHDGTRSRSVHAKHQHWIASIVVPHGIGKPCIKLVVFILCVNGLCMSLPP